MSAAPQTPTIQHEKEFIEATSRLYTFKLSTPTSPLSPISIRLSTNRLSFIARLLATNEDAYRHPDVILDLVNKLGYRNDALARIKSLAMIADSGLQASDYVHSSEICSQLFFEVEGLRKSSGASVGGIETKLLDEAGEVAWRSCFQLGKHEDFDDLGRRMEMLGMAMLLSPSSAISTILPLFTALESRLSAAPSHPASNSTTSLGLSNPLLFLGDQGMMVSPTIAAEAAARTFSRAASFFPQAFRSTSPHLSPLSPSLTSHPSSSLSPGLGSADGGRRSISPGSRTGLGVRDGAAVLGAGISSRLTKGVGWLIGAEANEMGR